MPSNSKTDKKETFVFSSMGYNIDFIDGDAIGGTRQRLNRFGEPYRTKVSYPYSYDAILQFQHPRHKEATGSLYTDRLLMWDYEKHNQLSQLHFGNQEQGWASRLSTQPAKVEAFLRDWTGDPKLILVLGEEHCNISTGYPCWLLVYLQPSKLKGNEVG